MLIQSLNLMMIALGHGATAFDSHTQMLTWVIAQMADRDHARRVAQLWEEYAPEVLLVDEDVE
jgi:hypothetical protein